MEPRIQYARTSDGVSIAYYSVGEGPAAVYMPPIPFRHVQRQWEVLPRDRQIADLAARQGRRLVQFDPRGMGSSSRVETFNLAGFVADLEAVVDSLNLETFDLVAVTYSTPIGVAYAARHPERLSRLVLMGPFASGSAALDTPVGNALRAIRGQAWEIYTRSAMQMIFGWEDSEPAQQMSAILREAIRPEDLLPVMDAIEGFDVSDLLERVRVPTLVVAGSASRLIPVEHSRAVAAAIRGAQFVAPPPGQDLLVVGQYLGLLGNVNVASARPNGAAPPSGTAIILFADIVDSTALTERLGDAAFRDKARDLDSALRTIIRDNGGTPIEGKLLGDGVLATFASAKQAIEAALACGRAGEEGGLPLHLGLHAGEDNNVFGGAVNIAARIAAASAPGETLVSATVRELARTSAGVSFEDRGEQSLKGIAEPVRVFAVRPA